MINSPKDSGAVHIDTSSPSLSAGLDGKPMVSILAPAYNEQAIIVSNLERLCQYMKSLEAEFRWELIVVNDGSKDATGQLADEFAKSHPNVKVFHHQVNRNLGGALQTGFNKAAGDYIVVMDIDLTYSEGHIGLMLKELRQTDADIVVASPYMKGGKNIAVPFFRLMLSRVVNWLMRFMSTEEIHTFTGMVRAYKAGFLRKLNLKSITYSINPEIIHKASILRGRVIEIPAVLDWSFQEKVGKSRASSIRIWRGILAGLMSGFIFRPYMFFLSIGLVLFLISLYIILWIFLNTFAALPELAAEAVNLETRFGMAVSIVFNERPYSFLVGGVCLIIAFQFLGIGFLSLQSKRYFDELFHINTSIRDYGQPGKPGNESHK